MFISTVAGSIGTVNECRRAFVIEESAREKATRRCFADKTVPWKTFKIIFFLICLIFVIIQSVDFVRIYSAYPTSSQQETIVPKNFKLPAITLCFKNTISFKDFCFYEPDWCERPSDMEEFCRKHPILCEEDPSNLTIPKQDYKTRKIRQTYLFNDSYNDALLFQEYKYDSKVRTFVEGIEGLGLSKCYSENLHLYQSGSKPEIMKLEFNDIEGDSVSFIVLNQRKIEPFYATDMRQVFLAIHSPYLPIDPKELHAIMPGTEYNIDIQLEKEEHLLPPPYQTNCRDNGPSKDAKEFANPNSYQMCLELCRSEFGKARYGCASRMTMISTVRDLCYGGYELPKLSSEQKVELEKNLLVCFQNCKQGCLKLHYKSTIKEIDLPDVLFKPGESLIRIYVKNPEVTVLRHVPLYGINEIFSNVGGLLGCWLGVSVFTLTDILEKFFRKVVRWKRRFRKRRFTLRRFILRRFRKMRFSLRRFILRRFTLRKFRKRIFRKRKEQRAPPTSEIHQD